MILQGLGVGVLGSQSYRALEEDYLLDQNMGCYLSFLLCLQDASHERVAMTCSQVIQARKETHL